MAPHSVMRLSPGSLDGVVSLSPSDEPVSPLSPLGAVGNSRSRLRGLRNLGNTCYMNAVLTALMGLPAFVRSVLSPLWGEQGSSNSASASPGTTLGGAKRGREPSTAGLLPTLRQLMQCHLSQLARSATQGPIAATAAALSPDAVRRALPDTDVQFTAWQQQDAHEFLVALLGQLHSECAARAKGLAEYALAMAAAVDTRPSASISGVNPQTCGTFPRCPPGTAASVASHPSTASQVEAAVNPVNGTFGFALRQQVVCANPACRYTRCHDASHFDLPLDFPPPGDTADPDPSPSMPAASVVDLNAGVDDAAPLPMGSASAPPPTPTAAGRRLFPLPELLQRHFQEETLQLRCERCGHDKVRSRSFLASLPRVLVLHLKRFAVDPVSGVCRKVNDLVPFPATLDMEQYCWKGLPPGTQWASDAPTCPDPGSLAVVGAPPPLDVGQDVEAAVSRALASASPAPPQAPKHDTSPPRPGQASPSFGLDADADAAFGPQPESLERRATPTASRWGWDIPSATAGARRPPLSAGMSGSQRMQAFVARRRSSAAKPPSSHAPGWRGAVPRDLGSAFAAASKRGAGGGGLKGGGREGKVPHCEGHGDVGVALAQRAAEAPADSAVGAGASAADGGGGDGGCGSDPLQQGVLWAGARPRYTCQAIIQHEGRGARVGHYTTLVAGRADGRMQWGAGVWEGPIAWAAEQAQAGGGGCHAGGEAWWQYNDSTVRRAAKAEVFGDDTMSAAYLLMYVLEEPFAGSA